MSSNELRQRPDIPASVAWSDLDGLEAVAQLLGTTRNRLHRALWIEKPEAYYRTWEIKKKSGGTRLIVAPQGYLKDLQSRLNHLLMASYRPKAPVHAYSRDRSIVTNARLHKKRTYVLNIDLQDFFPSIHFGRVMGVFRSHPFNCSAEAALVLAKICCADKALPTGAPTSPIMSNLVCRALDNELLKLAKDHQCRYSRYSDDITFSTARKMFPAGIAIRASAGSELELGAPLLNVINANGFEVNQAKTRLQDKYSRQLVTGIVVNSGLNLRREYIRNLRAMLHSWRVYGLVNSQAYMDRKYSKDVAPGRAPQFQDVLWGRISYLAAVRGSSDPLVSKLRAEFLELSGGQRSVTSTAVQLPEKTLSEIVILHLSDFHFRTSTKWDSRRLLSSLVVYLKSQRRPDFICVTGDVAFSGQPAEYKLAETFFKQLLESTGLTGSDIFFVPGNHDVARSSVSLSARALQDSILQSADHSILAEVLSDEHDRANLLRRFEAYSEFVTSVRGDALLSDPWWSAVIEKRGTEIHLGGFCTPWLSYQEQESSKLMLGLPQVGDVPSKLSNDAPLRIAMMHHPFSWLNDNDTPATTDVRNWSQMILRGHLHRSDALDLGSQGERKAILGAPSCYQGSTYQNGFHYLMVQPSSNACLVEAHRWDDSRKWFMSRDVFRQYSDFLGRFEYNA